MVTSGGRGERINKTPQNGRHAHPAAALPGPATVSIGISSNNQIMINGKLISHKFICTQSTNLSKLIARRADSPHVPGETARIQKKTCAIRIICIRQLRIAAKRAVSSADRACLTQLLHDTVDAPARGRPAPVQSGKSSLRNALPLTLDRYLRRHSVSRPATSKSPSSLAGVAG